MKLKSAQITNFRSVEDSGPFALDQVTSLVGKNEAGKSALLQALAALNPHPATPQTLDKVRDYPRRYLNHYDERHEDEEAVAVTTTWTLSADEQRTVTEAYCAGALGSDEVTILRRYEEKSPVWRFTANTGAVINGLLEKYTVSEGEALSLKGATDLPDLLTQLGALTNRSEGAEVLLKRLQGTKSLKEEIQQILTRTFPTFMYVSSYDRMDGAVPVDMLNTLVSNKQIDLDEHRGKKLFHEFFEFAGVPLASIITETRYEPFDNKLQSASNSITEQILEYWVQNQDLEVIVKIEQAKPGDAAPFNNGAIARARIRNNLHKADTPFSERSAGFIWFFSFLVKFDQVKKKNEKVIILLDEPGLTLHGKAQGQLLRYFDEKLAPHHQVIYSTHSPFMVAPDKLLSARIVEDQVDIKGTRRIPIGTKVRGDVLARDPDTIFPLQGALGYEISQSLFVGAHTLLVEGPSDILYLQAFSNELRARRRTFLDPRWTLCPSGGIDKIQPFISLFGGKKLHVAVLTDQGKGDKNKMEQLRKNEVLRSGHVYSVADFTGKTESDIEDLFEPELFVDILNQAYELKGANVLTTKKLDDADPSTPRLVKKAEAVFRLMPSVPTFDHFTPSAWLIRNSHLLEGDTPAVIKTLERAEAMFKKYNALLPKE